MRRRPGGVAAGLALCFLFLAWANAVTPMWADDYCRALDPGVGDAVAAAWLNYFDWTGRFFVTALTFVAMGTGWRWSMLPFDLLNALVFMGLIALVLRLAGLAAGEGGAGRGRVAGFADVLFAALLLWLAPRSVAEAALWKTGAIGYLWAVAGELLVLEWALALDLRGRRAPPAWISAPFAFVLATFLEPLSVVVSLALAALALRAWRAGRPVRWLFIMAAAHVAGCVALLAAPGNFARATVVTGLVGESPLADRVAGAMSALAHLPDGHTLVGLGVVIAAFALSTAWRRTVVMPRFGLAGAFVALAVLYELTLVAIPPRLIEPRLTFPASVLLVCAVVALFRQRPLAPVTDRLTVAVLAVLAAGYGAVAVRDLRAIAAVDRAWSATLAEAAPGGDVTLPLIRLSGGTVQSRDHRFFEGFTADPDNWINRCYARAWGMARIVGR